MTAVASMCRTDLGPSGTPLHRGRLGACVRQGLDMVELVLDEIVDKPGPDDDANERFRTDGKTVGEAAMLLLIAHRALPDPADRSRIARLGRRLAPHARSRAVRQIIVTRPSKAGTFALAHACLSAIGLGDASFDRLARLAVAGTAAHANERVPYRLLDAAWARHLLLGDGELGHPALMLSPIGVGVDLVAVTADDGYAFSHALPYATDFGRLPLPRTADTGRLLAVADALAVKALDEDDLDLLSELLMAPALLREPWSPTLAFAWKVLDATWIEHGFVPGPGLPPADEAESQLQAARRVLGTLYHTTFAAALCAATLLATGSPPPERIPPGRPAFTALPPLGKRRQWRQVWDQLGSVEQEQLGDFVNGLALRRSASDLDLVTMRELVLEAVVRGYGCDPMVEQCAELIQRAVANYDGR